MGPATAAAMTDAARTGARRDSARRRLLACADGLGLAVALFAVWLLNPPPTPFEERLVLLAALPAWIVLNKLLGLYDRDSNVLHKSTLDELPQLVVSTVIGTALALSLFPAIADLQMRRPQAVLFFFLAIPLIALFRTGARAAVRARYPAERCVIVGSGVVARLLARKIETHPQHGIKVLGFLDAPFDGPENDHYASDLVDGLLGDLDGFETTCRDLDAERVVIAFPNASHEALIDVIRRSKGLGLRISVVPRLFEAIGHSVEMDHIEGMTLLGISGLSRTKSSLALKRAIDVTGAGLGLLALSPFLIAIALAIKLNSHGPILFKQQRIGRGTKSFGIYKFRTMVREAEEMKADLALMNEAEGPMFKISDDPRITSVGKFLRRFSLDELPQLYNVLLGQMSLVGPRPLIPAEDTHVLGRHRDRLDLTPGITGPWQVLGRTAIPFQEMVKLDYLYVAEWSLWNDVKLLLRTAPLLFRSHGH
ncbi:MAG: sugar transferase [Thermoleophilaceae bacterium]|nr:sugar transferase [Thermoleophilaceae bacterium]